MSDDLIKYLIVGTFSFLYIVILSLYDNNQ